MIEWPLNKFFRSVVKSPNTSLDDPIQTKKLPFFKSLLHSPLLASCIGVVLVVAYMTFGIGHSSPPRKIADLPPVSEIETGENQCSVLMCDINDNGDRFLLKQDDMFYSTAKIDKSKGEDCFCELSEAEQWQRH